MATLPLEALGWDEIDSSTIQLYDVTWLEPWGPFVKGQTALSLSLNFDTGKIETYDEAGNPLVDINFKCVPTE